MLGHLLPAQIVAAGLRPPPELATRMAATQAAWRFYANEAVTLAACGRWPARSCRT